MNNVNVVIDNISEIMFSMEIESTLGVAANIVVSIEELVDDLT